MLVEVKGSRDADVHRHSAPRDFNSRLLRRLRRHRIESAWRRYASTRPAGLEYFSDDRSRCGSQLLASIPANSIVNIHWVAGFVDIAAVLPELARLNPIVWTLHDMNAFTGGCHYTGDCQRHREGCGACPQLGSTNSKDLSRDIWRRKHAALAQIPDNRLRIVCPSVWLQSYATQSPLLSRFGCNVIPSSLSIDDFAPRDRRLAREIFNVPPDSQVVLFVAASIANQRKGFHFLLKALATLDRSRLFCLCIGAHAPPVDSNAPLRYIGHFTDDRLLSLAYSAADIFVCPSLEDNLPNTIIEAQACGTPCVGFPVGGVPEMIDEGETGWIAPSIDAEGLAAAIEKGLRAVAQDNGRIAADCRAVAQNRYAPEEQARAYRNVYRELFHSSSAP